MHGRRSPSRSRSDGIARPQAARPAADRRSLRSALLALVARPGRSTRPASTTIGFETWRPVLYAYVLWAVALGVGQVLIRGERGQRALFVLPAVLFTIAMVIFPTLFGLYIAFTDWNLSSLRPAASSTASTILCSCSHDPYYWNALRNMVFYVLAVLVEYAIAFGLALLLNAEIRARKFFRVVFLLPFMLSPVAVSWMIGKSMMEYRFGPVATLARHLGWDNPAFFASPWIARISIMVLDAWVFDPLHDDHAARRPAGDAARRCSRPPRSTAPTPGRRFWQVTFPLMLPVSDHGDHPAHHLQAEARRHRHQRHLGRPRRRHRHGVELHLPRIPRPLECRLRHHAGDGLPGHHHRVRHAAAEARQPLHAQR